jgi:hypothetical protein
MGLFSLVGSRLVADCKDGGHAKIIVGKLDRQPDRASLIRMLPYICTLILNQFGQTINTVDRQTLMRPVH